MKIILLKSFYFIGFFFILNISYSQSSFIDNKRYDIESAFIKYNIYGNTKGVEVLKFDTWGLREINKVEVVREVVFYSVKNIQNIQNINILNKEFSYNIDLKNKTGIKTTSSNIVINNQFTKDEILKNNGKLLYHEMVLAKNCEVWKTNNLKIWLWKGIVLKLESKILGKNYIKEAIEIELELLIDSKELIVPFDIKITDHTK